ncbi:MAG: phosphatase PAP2 family protein [Sphingobacteriales bacterium]|nr:MAG: phosphatase PAP2 family protein [Sphingobacteriales bacterium]
MHPLIEFDRYLFTIINSKWTNGVFDATMPVIRNQYLWGPLYLFMLIFILVNFKKDTGWWLFFFAGTAMLTNFISSDLIKENIYRVRPCNDPSMAEHLRFLVTYRPKSSSFTSSHATNHFGLAAFFYYTLKPYVGKWAWLFFAWATVIIYAQVYVGVHYPLDVVCGGLIGFLFGYLSAYSYNKNYSLV